MACNTKAAAQIDFRSQLREATAERHKRLDARMGAIDLSTPAGRSEFQRVHDLANARVLAACGGSAAEATDYLARSTGRNSAAEVEEQHAPGEAIHPDAVAYVMLGSQLGLAYLRKSLDASHRTGVFQAEPDLQSWKSFLARIAANPPVGDRRERILNDSARGFDIFLSVADQTLSSHDQETR